MELNEGIELTVEEGKKKENDICLYALSTCGHCKRALKFLKDNEIAFKWVYIDSLPLERKNKLKGDLKEKFQRRIAFPFLVVNQEKSFVGFMQNDYNSLI